MDWSEVACRFWFNTLNPLRIDNSRVALSNCVRALNASDHESCVVVVNICWYRGYGVIQDCKRFAQFIFFNGYLAKVEIPNLENPFSSTLSTVLLLSCYIHYFRSLCFSLLFLVLILTFSLLIQWIPRGKTPFSPSLEPLRSSFLPWAMSGKSTRWWRITFGIKSRIARLRRGFHMRAEAQGSSSGGA